MDESILRKIRALIALASSSNPNEAASAMQKAQELMALHGISEADVELSAVQEASAKSGRTNHRPPTWMDALSRVVAQAFGVAVIWNGRNGYVCIGVGPAAEVSAYCFEVLRRQCERDRAAYYKRLRGYRQNRVRRADAFAEGWALAVWQKVRQFAQDCPSIVNQYIEVRYTNLTSYTPKSRMDNSEWHHASNGMAAGRNVDLNHGVGAAGGPIRIGHG